VRVDDARDDALARERVRDEVDELVDAADRAAEVGDAV
jgi:hypothetical protein